MTETVGPLSVENVSIFRNIHFRQSFENFKRDNNGVGRCSAFEGWVGGDRKDHKIYVFRRPLNQPKGFQMLLTTSFNFFCIWIIEESHFISAFLCGMHCVCVRVNYTKLLPLCVKREKNLCSAATVLLPPHLLHVRGKSWWTLEQFTDVNLHCLWYKFWIP